MGARIDWLGLMRAGLGPVRLGGLGLRPAEFWALNPLELQLMLGADQGAGALGRAGLAALMAEFPDPDPGPGPDAGNAVKGAK